MNHTAIFAQHRLKSNRALGCDEQRAIDLWTLEQLGIGPSAAGGYYETRCKWCGGSQHPPGAACVALDNERSANAGEAKL